MKKISIMIATYNEVDNISLLCDKVIALFSNELHNYDYEILIIDNDSIDGTRDKIRLLCQNNNKIRAIFNARNFGSIRSGFYGLINTSGDCVVKIAADFQEPVETIPLLVKEWEQGYPIVTAIKSGSEENKLMYWFRTTYYKFIHKVSDTQQIDQFTGFGLYDRKFINTLRNLDDPVPYFRGIVAELGGKRKDVYYKQNKRFSGKSKYGLKALYDTAMLGLTTYSKILLRCATSFGVATCMFSMVLEIIIIFYNFLVDSNISLGLFSLLLFIVFLIGLMCMFIGFLGEYIANINKRLLKRPYVIEEERINFSEE